MKEREVENPKGLLQTGSQNQWDMGNTLQARLVLYQRLTGEIRGLWVLAWIPVALY